MFAIYMYEYVCESALYFKHNWHCPMLLLISSTQNKLERVFNSVWHATFSEITLLHSHKFTVLFDNFFKENLMTASENLFTFSKRRDPQWTIITNNNKTMKISKNKIPKSSLKYSCKKLFWKYAANLQKNPHAEMFFNYIEIRFIQKIHK